MFKKKTIVFCASAIASFLFAASSIASSTTTAPEFGETQTLLENEDVRDFKLVDLNGNYRLDLVWLTNGGEIKYKLQANQAFQNFEDLKGTTWKMTYTNTNEYKWVTFGAGDGNGVIENQSGSLYNIVKYDCFRERGSHVLHLSSFRYEWVIL